MKVPLPKFLKDKSAAGGAGSVPSVPAISEENGGYVRGPSLMHLLQQPADEQVEEGKSVSADDGAGSGAFVPISLMHLLQPQPETTTTLAHDASLLHSATSVPISSFTPAFIPPPATATTFPQPASTDVSLSMPKLLFLRQSSIDESNTVVTTVPLDDAPSPAMHSTSSAAGSAQSFHHATVTDGSYLPLTTFPLHNAPAAASYPLPSPNRSLPIFSTAASASPAGAM